MRYKEGDHPVPGYQLIERLGAGGIGEVWLALGPGNLECAVKFIHGLEKKGGRLEFHALQLVKNIKHPHLVPIMGLWMKNRDGHLMEFRDYVPELDSSRDQQLPEPIPPTEAAPSTDFTKRQTEPLTGPLSNSTASTPSDHSVTRPFGDEPSVPRPSPAELSRKPSELIIAMGLGEKDLTDRLEEARGELPRAEFGGIAVEELLPYMIGAAKAIDRLNREGIQHCDIKPKNIMIVGNEAQVCDFGLAQAIGPNRKTSAVTIAYAPPEMFERGSPSESTDLYSLAVSYAELRTGHLPYNWDQKSVKQLVSAKNAKDGLNLEGLTPDEATVLEHALNPEPTKRKYRSCEDFVEAIVESHQDTIDPKIKQRMAIGAAIAALLCAGIWYGTTLRSRALSRNEIKAEIAASNFGDALARAKQANLYDDFEQTIGDAWFDEVSGSVDFAADDLEALSGSLKATSALIQRLPDHQGALELRADIGRAWFDKLAASPTPHPADVEEALTRIKQDATRSPHVRYRLWLLRLEIGRRLGRQDWSDLLKLLDDELLNDKTTSLYRSLLIADSNALRPSSAERLEDQVMEDVHQLAQEGEQLKPWESQRQQLLAAKFLSDALARVAAGESEAEDLVNRLGGTPTDAKLAKVVALVQNGEFEAATSLLDDVGTSGSAPSQSRTAAYRLLVILTDPNSRYADAIPFLERQLDSVTDREIVSKAMRSRLKRDYLAATSNVSVNSPSHEDVAEISSAYLKHQQDPFLNVCWVEATIRTTGLSDRDRERIVASKLLENPLVDLQYRNYVSFLFAEERSEASSHLQAACTPDTPAFMTPDRRVTTATKVVDSLSIKMTKPGQFPVSSDVASEAMKSLRIAATLLEHPALETSQRLRERTSASLAIMLFISGQSPAETIELARPILGESSPAASRELHYVFARAIGNAADATSADKAACLQSYATLTKLWPLDEQGSRGLPMYESVVAPAIKVAATINMTSQAPETLKAVAWLHHFKARLIQQNSAVHAAVASDEEKPAAELAFYSYEQAAKIDTAEAHYLVLQGIAFDKWKIRNEPVVVVRKLIELSKQAVGRNRRSAGAYNLSGYALIVRSRLVELPQTKRDHLKKAIERIDQAIAISTSNAATQVDKEQLATFYVNRSTALVEQAFLSSRHTAAERKFVLGKLRQAEKDGLAAAQRAKSTEQRVNAYIALGNACEDQAFYLGQTDRYDDALDHFKNATRVSNVLPFYTAHFGYGRCTMRFAMSPCNTVNRDQELDRALKRVSGASLRMGPCEGLLWAGMINQELAKLRAGNESKYRQAARSAFSQAVERSAKTEIFHQHEFQIALAGFEHDLGNHEEARQLAELVVAKSKTLPIISAAIKLAVSNKSRDEQLEWLARRLADSNARNTTLALRLARLQLLSRESEPDQTIVGEDLKQLEAIADGTREKVEIAYVKGKLLAKQSDYAAAAKELRNTLNYDDDEFARIAKIFDKKCDVGAAETQVALRHARAAYLYAACLLRIESSDKEREYAKTQLTASVKQLNRIAEHMDDDEPELIRQVLVLLNQ